MKHVAQVCSDAIGSLVVGKRQLFAEGKSVTPPDGDPQRDLKPNAIYQLSWAMEKELRGHGRPTISTAFRLSDEVLSLASLIHGDPSTKTALLLASQRFVDLIESEQSPFHGESLPPVLEQRYRAAQKFLGLA